MKRKIFTSAALWAAVCAITWAGLFSSLPKAKLTIKVMDDEGTPMSNMPVSVSFDYVKDESGTTDRQGIFVAEGHCSMPDPAIGVRKEGYYGTLFHYQFPSFPGEKDNKWQPWNPTVTAVVRRIVNPIPMYAKRVETAIPATNTPFGFDLITGDWVQPVGKGTVSDLVFRIHGFWRNYRDNDSMLELNFSRINDGLAATSHDPFNGRQTGSAFILPRYAPAGGYVSARRWQRMRRQSVGWSQDEVVDDVATNGGDYVFRIRSETNTEGIVTSAYFGKIPGSIEYVGASESGKGSWLRFTYYLNPIPNDRNLEFDPERSLFRNLKSTEQVTAP